MKFVKTYENFQQPAFYELKNWLKNNHQDINLNGYWKWWEKEYPDRAEAKKFNF